MKEADVRILLHSIFPPIPPCFVRRTESQRVQTVYVALVGDCKECKIVLGASIGHWVRSTKVFVGGDVIG